MIAYCIGFLFSASSQSLGLEGEVYLHNSKYKTGTITFVKDALVSSDFTGKDYSNLDGSFRLSFIRESKDVRVKISVVKKGFELVNEEDLTGVSLGTGERIKIFMARKGLIPEVQIRLLKICNEYLDQQYDTYIQHLDSDLSNTLSELSAVFGIEISDIFTGKRLLREKRDGIRKQLPALTKKLAKVNLDFSADFYLEAYEAFSQGEMSEVIRLLEARDLDISAEMNLLDGDQGGKVLPESTMLANKTSLSQKLEAIDLLAIAYRTDFRFQQAASVYRKKVQLLEGTGAKSLELERAYREIALTYFAYESYDSAKVYQKKALNKMAQFPDTDSPELAQAYTVMAIIQYELGNFDEAWDYQLRAIDIYKIVPQPDKEILADAYLNMASIHAARGSYQLASNFQQKAIAVKESLYASKHSTVAQWMATGIRREPVRRYA